MISAQMEPYHLHGLYSVFYVYCALSIDVYAYMHEHSNFTCSFRYTFKLLCAAWIAIDRSSNNIFNYWDEASHPPRGEHDRCFELIMFIYNNVDNFIPFQTMFNIFHIYKTFQN